MGTSPLTIGIVAGEASGDYLGAHLIAALKKKFPGLAFAGIGGPRMQAQGLQSWFPMERLAVRGYVEVLRHYASIVAIRRQLARRLLALRPVLFIGVDAPDFNLPLERWLKSSGIPTVHYVSPSLWAWRGERIRAIRRAVDRILVLFPFEEALYRDAGVPVSFVGHPMADEIPLEDSTAAAREELRLPVGARVIALLPGSRESELRYMAELFVRTARLIAERERQVRFLVPLANRATRALFQAALYRGGDAELPITVLFGHARTALAACDAALVASGTATLEAALYRKPMVITYVMAELSWRLMERMRYLPWVGLPNIIAGEFLVPEILQHDATPENLAQALLNLLGDPAVASRLPPRFAEIHRRLRRNSGEALAEAISPWLSA